MNQTLKYYNNNSLKLCSKYDLVDLSTLHYNILNFFKDCKTLLEIGSGSGRDMNFLIENGFDIIGIDGSKEMIRKAITNYPILKDKIILSKLPEDFPFLKNEFDGVFSIATMMHFNIEEIEILLKKFQVVLKNNTPVFISVSGIRNTSIEDDNRYFLELSKEKWANLFEKNYLRVIEIQEDQDKSGRDITWYSFFLKTDY